MKGKSSIHLIGQEGTPQPSEASEEVFEVDENIDEEANVTNSSESNRKRLNTAAYADELYNLTGELQASNKELARATRYFYDDNGVIYAYERDNDRNGTVDIRIDYIYTYSETGTLLTQEEREDYDGNGVVDQISTYSWSYSNNQLERYTTPNFEETYTHSQAPDCPE